jgi:hypothetical protein
MKEDNDTGKQQMSHLEITLDIIFYPRHRYTKMYVLNVFSVIKEKISTYISCLYQDTKKMA